MASSPRRHTTLCAALLIAAAVATPSAAQLRGQVIQDPRYAQTPILTDRFSLNLGGFVVDFDSEASAGVGSGVGGTINIEELLGLEANQNLFRLDGMYRFGPRGALTFTYYGITRSAEGSFAGEVDYLDLEFVGEYSAESTIRTFALTYRRSLINNGRIDAGMSAGLSTFTLDLEIAGQIQVIGDDPDNPLLEGADARESVIAPVPTLGMFIDYAITPRLLFRGSVALMNLSVGDFDGGLLDTAFTLDFFFSKHVGVGGGLGSTNIEVKNRGENPYRFNYRYSGFLLYLALAI